MSLRLSLCVYYDLYALGQYSDWIPSDQIGTYPLINIAWLSLEI